MSVVRLRACVHRGHVDAAGIAVDAALLGEEAARARVLEHMPQDSTILRIDGALVVLFKSPERLEVARAWGAPVVRYGRLLASAPLARDERAAIGEGEECFVASRGGEAHVAPLRDAVREDAATWLDLTTFAVVTDVTSLGEIAAAPKPAVAPTPADVRSALGAPDLSSEAASLLRALADRQRARTLQDEGASNGAPEGTALARASSWWSAVAATASWIASWFTKPAASSSNAAPDEPLAPKTASWIERVSEALNVALSRLVMSTRLARIVGQKHARYLQRMMDLFERGDLDDALKHAIPLGGDLEGELRRFPIAPLRARTDLAIEPHRVAGFGPSLGLGEDLYSLLQRRYRAAFERLEQRGDIEKAAFVLAELLNANEEAVSFLERHGRHRLAAELAEARKLPPGLVVRQWFLAGHQARAIAIARKTGAFADALARLENGRPEEARALRLLWADHLASAGEYSAAVDVVWPLSSARHLALAWVDRAIAVGGAVAARMWVKKARLVPDAFADASRSVAAMVDDADFGVGAARSVADEVLRGEASPEVAVLAKIAARALLDGTDDENTLARLLAATADQAFVVDVRGAKAALHVSRALRVRANARTTAGNLRTVNEDACAASYVAASTPDERHATAALDGDVSERGAMLVVFDGHALEPGVLCHTLRERLAAQWEIHGDDIDAWAGAMRDALLSISGEILRASLETRRGAGAGVTLVCIVGRTAIFAQVGDSRGYVLRRKKLAQMTRDHTLLNEYIAQGHLLTQQDIDEFPHKGVIVRALGMSESVDVDLFAVDLCKGDVILLCSDGMHGVLSDELMASMLLRGHPTVQAYQLERAATGAKDASDNVAVVVAHVDADWLPRSEGVDVPIRKIARAATSAEDDRARLTLRARADFGTMRIFDAAELPDGRLLVALGELGVVLLGRDGRTLARFAQPTHHVVLSDQGDRAILVAPRGEAKRIARLDVHTRRVQPWCDARIDSFSTDFDGATWIVARGGIVYAIDVTADGWSHTFQLEEPNRAVVAMGRDAAHFRVWLVANDGASPPSVERWSFEARSFTLRERSACSSSEREWLEAWNAFGGRTSPTLQLQGAWLASPQPEGGFEIRRPGGFAPAVSIALGQEAGACGVRVQGQRVLCFDARGRILIASMERKAIARELTLR